ncbi:MAG: hypothetical protein N2Z59_07100, partial [Alteraurantiacibacter sp.]|nr:hypothetical protein [Alteraurantiacibacter sp.]
MSEINLQSVSSSAQPASAADRAKPNWRKVFGLQEMGVFYALFLLIGTLAIITAYLGQANYLSIQNMS